MNGLFDCSGNVLLRAGNVIIGSTDYPAFNINNKSLHVNGGTTFNGNVTINSSTTTGPFLSISSQTGNSIAIGRGAVANGSNSIAIGNVALINGFTNSVAIGNGAVANGSNSSAIGASVLKRENWRCDTMFSHILLEWWGVKKMKRVVGYELALEDLMIYRGLEYIHIVCIMEYLGEFG